MFLVEWREKRNLTQKQLGDRLGVADMTVSRWERKTAQLSTDVLAAVSEALDIEPTDLYRHPDQPSADALLRGAPDSLVQSTIAHIIDARRRA